MSRLPRIDLVGVPQHIVVRGVDRQPCFFRDADHALYLDILIHAAARHSVAIHAFVLMTNHVHLLATGSSLGGVSAMMQLIGLRYVRRVNGLYGRTGTLFEGRFRGSLVQSDRYLLACMRYIEVNPLRARMVNRPEHYPWSSYRCNAGLEHNSWLTRHEQYMRLAPTERERTQAWRALVSSAPGKDEWDVIRNHLRRNCVLGDRSFQECIAATLGRRVHIAPPGRPLPKRVGECASENERRERVCARPARAVDKVT